MPIEMEYTILKHSNINKIDSFIIESSNRKSHAGDACLSLRQISGKYYIRLISPEGRIILKISQNNNGYVIRRSVQNLYNEILLITMLSLLNEQKNMFDVFHELHSDIVKLLISVNSVY